MYAYLRPLISLYDNHQAEKKDFEEIRKVEKSNQENFFVRIWSQISPHAIRYM